jgi:hypothetical protein
VFTPLVSANVHKVVSCCAQAWCSATLFAALAAHLGDEELRAAAEAVLASYARGSMVYAAEGPGTAGHVDGVADVPIALSGRDAVTLALVDTALGDAGRGESPP